MLNEFEMLYKTKRQSEITLDVLDLEFNYGHTYFTVQPYLWINDMGCPSTQWQPEYICVVALNVGLWKNWIETFIVNLCVLNIIPEEKQYCVDVLESDSS